MTDRLSYILRASSLPTYLDCGRRWAVQHLAAAKNGKREKGKDEAKEVGALIGVMCHSAAQRLLIAQIDGEVLELQTVIDDQVAEFHKIWKSSTIAPDKHTRSKEEGGAQIARMITVFYEDVFSEVNPYAVELELKYQNRHLFRFEPRIDLICRSPMWWLIDFKFGHSPGLPAPQLGVYTKASEKHLSEELGETVEFERVTIIHIPRVKLATIQPRAQYIEYTRDQVVDSIDMVEEDLERELLDHEQDEALWPFRPRPASNFCNKNTCEAHGTTLCNQWTKE